MKQLDPTVNKKFCLNGVYSNLILRLQQCLSLTTRLAVLYLGLLNNLQCWALAAHVLAYMTSTACRKVEELVGVSPSGQGTKCPSFKLSPSPVPHRPSVSACAHEHAFCCSLCVFLPSVRPSVTVHVNNNFIPLSSFSSASTQVKKFRSALSR